MLLRPSYLALTGMITPLRLLPMSNTDKDVEILTVKLGQHVGASMIRRVRCRRHEFGDGPPPRSAGLAGRRASQIPGSHHEAALAVLVSVLVLIADLRGVIAFSSVGVLVYYAIANAAAVTLPAEQRRWPRTLHLVGTTGCLVLIVTLPLAALVAGIAVLATGLGGRLIVHNRRRSFD